VNRPTPPKPPEPRIYPPKGDYTNQWAAAASIIIFLLMCFLIFSAGVYSYKSSLSTKQVDVVVVDKYEGLKHGTTAFFVETCLKNDMKRCELDTIYRREWDMIEVGEQWTLEVRNAKY
jgi:hypothetical protein